MSPSRARINKLRSKKVLLLKLALLAASVLFGLLGGEVYYRLRFAAWPFDPERTQLPHLTEKDVNLRWRYSSDDGRNSLGMRNREIAGKGSDVFRIMLLGDSLIWTGETSSKKLFSQVVEENLNEASSTTRTIEVINAGIPGYTTYQEIEFLNVYGYDMDPDVVVLGFVFNDLFYKYLHRVETETILAPEPETRRHRFDIDSFPGVMFSRSYLAHEMAYAFEKLVHKLGRYPYYNFERHDDVYLAWKDYGWADTERLIGELAGQLSDRDIPLIILIFPISDQVDKEYLDRDRDYVLYPQSRIKAICDKFEIPYLDLTEALQRAGGREIYSDYVHLTGEGNDVIADELTWYFTQERAYMPR